MRQLIFGLFVFLFSVGALAAQTPISVRNLPTIPNGAITFGCTVAVSTLTTVQAVGGNCVAPGAGLSLYVTDISFSANAAGIAADSFPTLKYGTGGTCGSGTAVWWGAFIIAATQGNVTQAFRTAYKVPANNEICWIESTAGSKFIVINGYIAP